jgi:hypothetical protein
VEVEGGRVRPCRRSLQGILTFYLAHSSVIWLSGREVIRCGGRPRGFLRKIARLGPRQEKYQAKGLILAQNERWRRGLGMQVERERFLRKPSKVADG